MRSKDSKEHYKTFQGDLSWIMISLRNPTRFLLASTVDIKRIYAYDVYYESAISVYRVLSA